MRLTVLFFNAGDNVVGETHFVTGGTIGFFTAGGSFITETHFVASGNSAGWLGTIAASPFVKRQQEMLVPAGAGKIRVALVSAGPLPTVGVMVIDDLTVALHPTTVQAGNLFPNPTFEEGDQLDNPTAALPAGIWARGGSDGSIDQVSIGNSVSRSHSLSLLDNNETGYGEWYGFLTLVGVVPGDVLDFQWFQLYSVTNGSMRLILAFTDAVNGQLESHDYNVSGDSPGWAGSVATSPFERQNKRLLVPPGTVKLRVNLASGGSSLVTGTMLIDDLSVAITKPRITELVPQVGSYDLSWDSIPGKTYTVRFASTLGSPTVWTSLTTGWASGGLTTTYSDTATHAGSGGFYRVIQE